MVLSKKEKVFFSYGTQTTKFQKYQSVDKEARGKGFHSVGDTKLGEQTAQIWREEFLPFPCDVVVSLKTVFINVQYK